MSTMYDAVSLARKYHAGQKYGTRDYVEHLFSVRDAALDNMDDVKGVHASVVVIVAILHDILEDTECTYEELVETFGEGVAESVACLTKVGGESYEYYIEKVKSDEVAWIVKIADTRCNLRQSILDDNKGCIVKYAKQLMLLEGL